MDLHYSQTKFCKIKIIICLNPLWIYTTLKQLLYSYYKLVVWIPYGFTLLSNGWRRLMNNDLFESPMDLHYSQTLVPSELKSSWFESPMDLHYSQTVSLPVGNEQAFESPMDLHYSQTSTLVLPINNGFESPMDLHYSQTCSDGWWLTIRLNPLWIYTTLKPTLSPLICCISLNPLWIYTTLKPIACHLDKFASLNPLWIYTTLKRRLCNNHGIKSLNPLWIYTTLKLGGLAGLHFIVWIPYGFTLLSN